MNIQHEIDALQAEKIFRTLLDWIDAGDEVVITVVVKPLRAW